MVGVYPNEEKKIGCHGTVREMRKLIYVCKLGIVGSVRKQIL